ncbi:hypothetical protein D3C87_1662550 [compost metagenome]
MEDLFEQVLERRGQTFRPVAFDLPGQESRSHRFHWRSHRVRGYGLVAVVVDAVGMSQAMDHLSCTVVQNSRMPDRFHLKEIGTDGGIVMHEDFVLEFAVVTPTAFVAEAHRLGIVRSSEKLRPEK